MAHLINFVKYCADRLPYANPAKQAHPPNLPIFPLSTLSTAAICIPMKSIDDMLRELKALGTSAAEVSEEMDVSRAAMSRFRAGLPTFGPDKIAQFYAIYARRMKVARTAAIEPSGTSRNADIARRALAGEDYASVARGYGLTRERVRQIVASKGLPARRREK